MYADRTSPMNITIRPRIAIVVTILGTVPELRPVDLV